MFRHGLKAREQKLLLASLLLVQLGLWKAKSHQRDWLLCIRSCSIYQQPFPPQQLILVQCSRRLRKNSSLLLSSSSHLVHYFYR